MFCLCRVVAGKPCVLFLLGGGWKAMCFFLEEGAGSPRSMGAPSLMSFFLGGTPKIVGNLDIFLGEGPPR